MVQYIRWTQYHAQFAELYPFQVIFPNICIVCLRGEAMSHMTKHLFLHLKLFDSFKIDMLVSKSILRIITIMITLFYQTRLPLGIVGGQTYIAFPSLTMHWLSITLSRIQSTWSLLNFYYFIPPKRKFKYIHSDLFQVYSILMCSSTFSNNCELDM